MDYDYQRPVRRRHRKKLKTPEALELILERTDDPRLAKLRPPVSPRQWEAVVGAHVATRTQPLALEGDVLFVRAATSAWAHELSLLEADLVAKLAKEGFAVKRIRFRVGAIDPPLRPPERRAVKRAPAAAELPADVRASLSAVRDDELRDALDAAARRSLGFPPPRGKR